MVLSKVKEDFLESIATMLFGYQPEAIEKVRSELDIEIEEKAIALALEHGKDLPGEDEYELAVDSIGGPKKIKERFRNELAGKRSQMITLSRASSIAIAILLLSFSVSFLFTNERVKDFDQYYDLTWWHVSVITMALVMLFISLYIFRSNKKGGLRKFSPVLTSVSIATAVLVVVFILPIFLDYTVLGWFFKLPKSDAGTSVAVIFLVPFIVVQILGFMEMYRLRSATMKHGSEKMSLVKPLIAVIVVALLIAVPGYYINMGGHFIMEYERMESTEYIGGRYNASLEYWYYHDEDIETTIDIRYWIDDREERGNFHMDLRPSMDWIKENTDPNATFACWWDYGHAIRGYAERNVIITAPTEDMEYSLTNPDRIHKWAEDMGPIQDVARIFLAEDEEMAREVAEIYNATYIYIPVRDPWEISYIFYDVIEWDVEDFDYTESPPEPTEEHQSTIMMRTWSDDPPFEVVYSDVLVKILKIPQE